MLKKVNQTCKQRSRKQINFFFWWSLYISLTNNRQNDRKEIEEQHLHEQCLPLLLILKWVFEMQKLKSVYKEATQEFIQKRWLHSTFLVSACSSFPLSRRGAITVVFLKWLKFRYHCSLLRTLNGLLNELKWDHLFSLIFSNHHCSERYVET